MKKILIASVLIFSSITPSYAWWDSYGGFTCGYLDPLTSILDSIFGPPCPPPQPVVIEQPVVLPPAPVQAPVAVPIPGRQRVVPRQPATSLVIPGPIYDCPMRAVPYPYAPEGVRYVPNC